MSIAVVTGAAGFIGSHLIRRLAETGVLVRAVDVRPLRPEPLDPLIRYHCVDIRNGPALRKLLGDVDIVYHLASAHLEVNASARHFEEVNVRAAMTLAELCAASGVGRLVHTSSVGVYGHVVRPPAAEDAPCAPRNRYERTKLLGEAAVLAASAESGLHVLVLRPSWVYGSGCSRMAKLLRSLRRGRFLYIGRGFNLRHPLFIDDLLHAYSLAAQAPADLARRVYNIAGPRALPLRAVVESCARLLDVEPPQRSIPRLAGLALGSGAELIWGIAGREPPFSRRSLAFFDGDNAYDTTAVRQDLGFVARVELEDGLRRMLARESWMVAA